jgi:hypothetical protein
MNTDRGPRFDFGVVSIALGISLLIVGVLLYAYPGNTCMGSEISSCPIPQSAYQLAEVFFVAGAISTVAGLALARRFLGGRAR